MSRYVQVKFPHGMRPPHRNDRAYLYLSDVRLEVGDRVVVPVHDGTAERDAIVHEIGRGTNDYPGPYDTVIRRVPADSTYTSRTLWHEEWDPPPLDENGNVIITQHHEPESSERLHTQLDTWLEERRMRERFREMIRRESRDLAAQLRVTNNYTVQATNAARMFSNVVS